MATDPASTTTREALLQGYPEPVSLTAEHVLDARGPDAPGLVVLDDDPP